MRIVLKKGKYFTAIIHLACVCMCTHTYVLACACTKVYVWEVKELAGSRFSPSTRHVLEIESDGQTWQQIPLPAESSCQLRV